MKNQKQFRVLTLIGVFALLSVTLSSCFYGGYGYRDRYYSRPAYRYPPPRYQTRVYVAPPRRHYSNHDNHYRKNNSYSRNNRGNSRNSRR
jgi:hypothetical protein